MAEYTIEKMGWTAATIAVAAVAIAIVWTTITAIDPSDSSKNMPADKTGAKSQIMCEAIGGTWATSSDTCS